MRRKYLRKCQEVQRLKVGRDKDALALLSSKVSPRFFRLLRAEVRNYSRKPQARRWTQEELADYETMRQRGPRAFRVFPITKPTRKTLKAPWKKLRLTPGVNKVLLSAVAKKVAAMPEEDRACFVMFDEISLKVYLSLLEKLDLVSGYVDTGDGDRGTELAEEALVLMVRSVYGKWKMPIAFWYTHKKMTGSEFAKIFGKALGELLEAGLEVRAMVTDALQKNFTAEQILGATYEKPYFYIGLNKIFTIADPPHLLKALRNALLKYLILRPDGTLVDVKFIRAFILRDLQMPVRLAPKLNKGHINVSNFTKMNVPLAAQLLSDTTASGVLSYTALGLLPPEAAGTGKFCEDMDKLFDSFNGTKYDPEVPAQPDDFKTAISENSPHLELWKRLLADMKKWQFLGGSERVVVTRNWNMTIRAVTLLWRDLWAEGRKYFPVGHLNQDAEENMFCGLRFNGGNRTNPSPEDFPAAFLQSFVKATTSETKGKNCRDDEAVDLFVVEELLQILDQCAAPVDAGEEGDLQQEAVDENLDLEVLEEVPGEEEMMD